VTLGVAIDEVVTVGVPGCVGSDGTGTVTPTDVPVPVSIEALIDVPSLAAVTDGGSGVMPPDPSTGLAPPPVGGVGAGVVGVAGGVPGVPVGGTIFGVGSVVPFDLLRECEPGCVGAGSDAPT
jgi:hypothetical protein